MKPLLGRYVSTANKITKQAPGDMADVLLQLQICI